MVDRNTLEGRLRWAIERPSWREGKKRGLRLFQSRMEPRVAEVAKAGGPILEGVALSSIQTYLNGDVVPPLPFLREAAPVLGVREAWLISGDGFPTEEENATARGIRMTSSLTAHPLGRLVAESRLRETLGEGGFGFWELPDTARESVVQGFETYRWLVLSREETGRTTPTEANEQQYASYLAAPFTILGIDPEPLEPVERALMVDALLRPLEIFRWASRREWGRRRTEEREAEQKELEKDPLYRQLTESWEHEDEAEDEEVVD